MKKNEMIFGNKIADSIIEKSEKAYQKYLKKFGDDRNKQYQLQAKPIETLDFLNVQNLVLADTPCTWDEKALIVGNIRMGFGHYRIAIAMASCAKALGYTPYWMDLASFDTTGSKMIRHQNDLYSFASRISQKSVLFNKLYWEKLNSEGFKKITYNASDQKNSELLKNMYASIPTDTPYIATHVWPAQGAIHAGMTHVVNAIPDNWPMGLHLAQGSIHTVQTDFAYLGYKTLWNFDTHALQGMKDAELKVVGNYIDHELVSNLEDDNLRRKQRMEKKEPYRILLTVGGAGAGADLILDSIQFLLPYIQRKEVALFINFGDHLKVYEYLCKKIPDFESMGTSYFDAYDDVKKLVDTMHTNVVEGMHFMYSSNIFEAVYTTNLLMRECELMATKPSELAYYPIPKLMIRHIGGHEVYGAIHSAELGDGTFECSSSKDMIQMLEYLLKDKEITNHMIDRINVLKQQGYYNGAYECVRLAVEGVSSCD